MSATSDSGGLGFCSVLTLLFIGLKLGAVIDWSWWWVLSPMWIPFAIVLLFLLLVILFRSFNKR